MITKTYSNEDNFEFNEDSNYFHHDYDEQDDESTDPSVPLDEDGLPNLTDTGGNGKAESNTFASDFYKCGSDWSSLITTNTKLKQSNLFEMWKLPLKNKHDLDDSNSNNLPPNKKIKKSNNALVICSTSTSASNKSGGGQKQTKPRACPFYKKLPGMLYANFFRFLVI